MEKRSANRYWYIEMRVFISVNLPETIKQEIQTVQARLQPKTKHIRWIAPENMHITLRFIGKYPDEDLQNIYNVLDLVAKHIKPFEIGLNGFGTFPPKGKPAVLWIGVQPGAAMLTALANHVASALREGEIAADPKPFVPHITIGRAIRHKPVFVPETIRIPMQNTRFPVQSFYLMESILRPEGALYAERFQFDLKG